MARKTIKVNYLARVEGEGAFKVVIRDGVVRSAELSIFEPPRFFEAFLRGRDFAEAPDITAYTQSHPHLADAIRRLFPLLGIVESAALDDEPAVPTFDERSPNDTDAAG